MSRAKNKSELIAGANENFAKMWRMIDEMPAEMQTAKFNFGAEMGKEAHWARDKNIRDILVHLYEWHELLLNFVAKNLENLGNSREKTAQKFDEKSREIFPFLPEPYTWKNYGEMNEMLWKKHQSTEYENARKLVKNSHEEVMKLAEKFSDDELFAKKHFPWTGTTNLGAYFISATASHYDWALKKLKAHAKTYKK